MKTVAAGAHYTTVTVDTAEAVKFSFPSTSLSVEATGGNITVALTDTAQAGDDETITVPNGESRMFIHHRMNVDTYYLTGSGTAKLYASNMGDVNPFKAGKRGGDAGGDNTHYKGTTTTPLANGSTTNPIVIDGESYTAAFGDVVVYGYTEFVFDGAAWSEFGRPFDTVPTQGSTNAVTSDGIYKRTPFERSGNSGATFGNNQTVASGNHAVAIGTASQATQRDAFAAGYYAYAWGLYSSAFGFNTRAKGDYSHVVGQNNNYRSGDLFEVGNGNSTESISNILEVNRDSMNVNGDIKINNVAIPTPYTTMPTITESMLGQIAMYVGATGGGFTQGCFYVASTDGAAEPTYSWVRIGGGRTETVLWQYDSSTMQPGQDITLSDKLSNYDEICFIPYYVAAGITTRTGNSCYLGSQFAGASDSNRKYLSVTGVTTGAAEYCDFQYDGDVTLYFGSLSVSNALWVYSIIGIKY